MLLEQYDPKRLVIFSRDELKQFEMAREFQHNTLRFFLGDVRDLPRLCQAFREIDYVIHAAALKQVPSGEYNPMECIKTNIHGAENVITAALECGVEKVIALSSDKASNPINLYGATKLVSDKLFVAANNMLGDRRTRFSIVRYGNVVDSRGSVIPYFNDLIKKGVGELPITHPEMTRFWIRVEQGAEFVMNSFSRMQGGEIFIPKLPSVKVTEIAEAMAPHLKIRIVGARPGEKLHEVMIPRDNALDTIEFENHYVIKPAVIYTFTADYHQNPLNEIGAKVSEDFEYMSLTNPHYLTLNQIRAALSLP
jgi:UDP-N-acetylglucosamine 4,6-dehydratase/5-epimerase